MSELVCCHECEHCQFLDEDYDNVYYECDLGNEDFNNNGDYIDCKDFKKETCEKVDLTEEEMIIYAEKVVNDIFANFVIQNYSCLRMPDSVAYFIESLRKNSH